MLPEAQVVHHFAGPFAGVRSRPAADQAEVEDVIVGREHHLRSGFLRDDRDVRTDCLRVLEHVVAQDERATRGRLELGREDPQEGRLARAVAAEQTEDLAPFNREGDALEGLRPAAIAAAEADPELTIALVSKVYPMRSHTVSAEGGTAAVLRDYDSFELHALDTIKGSDFLADQDAVEFFVARCPEEIIRLEHWGCPWSRDEDGRVSQRAFGGMSVKRTVYAADKVGFHILHTLFQTSMKYDRIHRFDEYFVTSLIVDGGACAGVVAMNLRGGTMVAIQGKATILATGGCGRVYEFTTNGFIKTGDG